MVCMILQECGNLDLSGELVYVQTIPPTTEWLSLPLMCGRLCLQDSAFYCEWQCCCGEIGAACDSHAYLSVLGYSES